MENIDKILYSLSKSKFRSSFHLKEKDKASIKDTGMDLKDEGMGIMQNVGQKGEELMEEYREEEYRRSMERQAKEEAKEEHKNNSYK